MNGERNSLLVVWHSRTGAARQLAVAATRGARRSLGGAASGGARQDGSATRPISIDCVHASRVDAQQMCAASAYLFVAPENLASLTGVMKEFFDRNYYGVLDRIAGRPYAVIVAAGSDGQGAVRQIERIATGWRLKAVAEPIIVITHAQTVEAILAPKRVPPEELARAAELGEALAQGLAMGIF